MKHVSASRLRWLGRLFIAAGLALLVAAPGLAEDGQPKVYVLPTSGTVDQVMAGYIHDGLAKAAREGAAAAVIELDTPGGDLTATRDIVTTLLNAPLPVIVWVGPAGSRAASAGTFLTLAANVATMAPGARHRRRDANRQQRPEHRLRPAGEGPRGHRGAAAQHLRAAQPQLRLGTHHGHRRSLVHGRGGARRRAASMGWRPASRMPSPSLTAGPSPSRASEQTLDLADAQIEDLSMNPLQSLLHLLSDPNIAFILFTIGFYGLLFELANPNFVTGILGGIAIILAFIGFGSLPLNLAGLLLIGLGIVLFALEADGDEPRPVGGRRHRLLRAGRGGAVHRARLARRRPTSRSPCRSWSTMTVLTAGFMGLIAIMAFALARGCGRPPGLIGAGLPADAFGEVRRPLTPIGSVYAGGEEWTARTADERPLQRGTPVRILRQEGLTLIVEPAEGRRGVKTERN